MLCTAGLDSTRNWLTEPRLGRNASTSGSLIRAHKPIYVATKKGWKRLLYDRGPVILHDLCNRVGAEQFLKLCRRFHQSDCQTTLGFLTLVQEMFGNSIGQWLEDQLKEI